MFAPPLPPGPTSRGRAFFTPNSVRQTSSAAHPPDPSQATRSSSSAPSPPPCKTASAWHLKSPPSGKPPPTSSAVPALPQTRRRTHNPPHSPTHQSKGGTASSPLALYPKLRHLRVVRARHRLREGVAVKVISAELGFCNQTDFTKDFRNSMGATPSFYQSNELRSSGISSKNGHQGLKD
jgi:hypothetical protein